MPDFSVFYAWQSDLPPKTTRRFIEDAAKRTIKNIEKDISIEESPRLDSDTKGESGMPEIVSTIFNKIEGCGIFLADLTFVGESYEVEGKKRKKLPNANVLLELGHASSRVGWDRMICVMNSFYGGAEETIFDIKHRRFPITFHLESESDPNKNEIKKKLVNDLKYAIKSAMQSEHQAVIDSLKSLDSDCFSIMSSYGTQDIFRLPSPRFKADQVSTQVHVHAARHMLELGLLETHFDYVRRTVSYTWTYLGILVLKNLSFRKQ